MKKLAKRLAALALAAMTFVMPAGAVTPDGQNETWFDSIWELIQVYGLEAEDNPYVLQNYINKYLAEHPEEMYNVINDILSLLDTHSMYLSSEEYSQGFSTLEGFVGIGVGMQETVDGVQIAEVMRFSSAEEAGLQIGDMIIAVDGVDTTEMTNTEVAELLRGAEGTTVSVTVRRQGRDLTVTCTRRQVNQVYVSSSTPADGVEYIKVSAMGSENDWTAFSEIWEGLDEKNTRAVILDLRGNGGGVIDVALKMADAMTEDEGVYLAGTRWREDMGGLEQTYSTGGLPLNQIVVLVDGGTASAAELLAGSLQDTADAVLVGETTYGKGQGQFHIELINGDKLVITTLELELPRQGSYEGVGLTPDLQVENRQVTVNAASLTPLDTTRTLRFGDQSDAVYAMTERLALFGLIDEATNTYDGDVVEAVTAFRESYEMDPELLYASPDMLQALDEAMQTLDGQTHVLDDQLQAALEICKQAAEKPQRYIALPDGSWKKN